MRLAPPGWLIRDANRLERWGEGGIPVQVGLEARRECGCSILAGLRLDRPAPDSLLRFEPTLAFFACSAHKDAAGRAHHDLTTRPPGDEEILALAVDLLD